MKDTDCLIIIKTPHLQASETAREATKGQPFPFLIIEESNVSQVEITVIHGEKIVVEKV